MGNIVNTVNLEIFFSFIKQDKLPWINVSDLKYYQSEAAELYNVDRIPSAFLLDPDGKIIAKHTDLRGPNLSRKLAEIFN